VASRRQFHLRQPDRNPDTAYLELPDYPPGGGVGIVKRTIDVQSIVENYNGPRLSIDFDAQNRPIGIEIIYPTTEIEEDN